MTYKNLLTTSLLFITTYAVWAQDTASARLKNSDPSNYYLAEGKKKGFRDDYRGSIAEFTTALLFNPKNNDALYNRGLAYYYVKSYDSSVTDITAAIKVDSVQESYYTQLGINYSMMGNYANAKKAFDKSLTLNPKSLDGNLNMGVMYLSTGNYDLACQYLHKAKEYGSKKAQDAMDVYCKGK